MTARLKRLGRFHTPGKRVLGDGVPRNRYAGWQYVHLAIDDHSRLAYAEILPTESPTDCARFLNRAASWYLDQGVTIERVISDNGNGYRSFAWRDTCTELGIQRRYTQPRRIQALLASHSLRLGVHAHLDSLPHGVETASERASSRGTPDCERGAGRRSRWFDSTIMGAWLTPSPLDTPLCDPRRGRSPGGWTLPGAFLIPGVLGIRRMGSIISPTSPSKQRSGQLVWSSFSRRFTSATAGEGFAHSSA